MMGLRFIRLLHEGSKSDDVPPSRAAEQRRHGGPGTEAAAARSGFRISPSAWQIALTLLLLIWAVFLRTGTTTAQDVCVTHDQPNQLADRYPNSATGTLNATLMVAPISMAKARQLVPAKYAIMEDAMRAAFPSLAEGMYPVVVQAAHDHDIQFRAYNMSISDFSRVGFEFPFIDLLGDGQSAFRWAPAQMITSSNFMAIGGSRIYGTTVTPATFEPECNAYAHGPDGSSTYFRAQSKNGARFVEISVSPQPQQQQQQQPSAVSQAARGTKSKGEGGSSDAELLAFLETILNQPAFASGGMCDRMQRPFHTPLSQGAFAPRFVAGSVRARLGPFADGEAWEDARGVQLATPFVEDNYLNCRTLRAQAAS